MKRTLLLLSVFLGALLVFTSCEDDDKGGDVPDYVGTWVNSYIDEVTSLPTKETLTLTVNTFEQVTSIQNPLNSNWYDVGGLKGTMEVDGQNMTITVTSAGYAEISFEPGLSIGTFDWYDEGTPKFDELIDEYANGETSLNGNWSIDGNQLSVGIDGEDENETVDPEEITVYTKQ